MKEYKKIYIPDTNIILDNANNILQLSQEGSNLIVIPETVLDEIDSKKSGLDEINYQARQFARLLYDAEILNKSMIGNITIIETKVHNTTIYIISKENYKADTDNTSGSIKNDRKILEITKEFMQKPKYNKAIFVSLDVMARTRAISLGIPTETMTLGIKESSFVFHKEIFIDDFNGSVNLIDLESYNIEQENSSLCIENSLGNKYFYFLDKNKQYTLVDDKNTKKFPVPALNLLQRVAAEIIFDKTDITIISGKAGSGKNLISLSAAMRLIDTSTFEKIYYIRKTIASEDSEGELGFLPGTLEEKMKGYNYPMEDSLYKMAKLKKKNATDEDIEEMISDYKEKYKIEYLYTGHLRGSTLNENSIIIIDEAQNYSINNIKTIISRVSKNSIVIVLGSNNQIDSKYLSINTNALTALMRKSNKDESISIRTIELKNIIRSEIAEWIDKTF